MLRTFSHSLVVCQGSGGIGQGDFGKWDPRGPILPCIFLLQSKLHPQGWRLPGVRLVLLPDFSEILGEKLSTLIFLLIMRTPLLSFLVRPG